MRNEAKAMATGGITAALAVIILCLGTLIPLATFVCPVACILLLQVLLRLFGSRVAWAWYGAVAILGCLMCPDREAAGVFAILGYYPIVKPWLEKRRLRLLWKLLLFNGAALMLYGTLIHLLGMQELGQGGAVMALVTLGLGNVTFWALDRLLTKLGRQ